MTTSRTNLQPSADHEPLTSQPRRRFPGAWKWLVLVAVLLGVGASAWFWLATPSLTEAEQGFVGKWTLPMGPNPPPANAVQQVFWLQADRTLLVGHRPVTDVKVTYSMRGTWRLEGDRLVVEAQGAAPPAPVWDRINGSAPKPPRWNESMRVLDSDADSFRVAAEGDTTADFVRLRD
jgi:hypothetical protein